MSDIDEVKNRTDIISVIGAKVTLKKAGRHWKALCPFHSEKTPSFIVSPERQSWHCFGCGKGGSVIDFVMEQERVDFVEALESLAEKAGVKLERRHADTPEAKLKEKIIAANHLASEYYQYLLTQHTIGVKAREYLKNRGVTDKTIKSFALGYSANSWDGLLKYLIKKGFDGETLEKAGLVVQKYNQPSSHNSKFIIPHSSFYDRFRGRVMFTLKDHRGNVVGFSGRLLDPEAKEAKYINTSETLVYSKSNVLYGMDVTKAAIQQEGEAVVMEGEFDVISSFQVGVGNVVAIKGSALTEGHVNLLRRFAERIILALDSDPAGDAASRRGIEIADRAGLDVRVVRMPSGKDPDEAARENPGLLKKAIKAAEPVYDYFLASATKRHDPRDAFGKRKISDELLPIIGKIENPIVRGHYLKKLANALDLSEETIDDALRKALRAGTTGRNPDRDTSTAAKNTRSREENLEMYVLALLVQGKTVDLYEELSELVRIDGFTVPSVRQIISLLGVFINDHRIFLIKDFADSLPKELLPVFDEAFLWDIADLLDDAERMSKEWTKAVIELKRTNIKRRMSELSRELSHDGQLSKEREEAVKAELRTVTESLKTVDNPR
ncbi:DNA primase [Candidatus Gottesmanbacteria bacterium]|nr:DNA primase [Candidatus Gottesmanbacteria bacterium]